MSGDQTADEITTASDFEAALGDLLDAALQNGIDPQGSWVYKDDNRDDNWEVEVYELE